MKYKLEFPFQSISGVISRQQLADGSVRTIYCRKDGVMVTRISRKMVPLWSRERSA